MGHPSTSYSDSGLQADILVPIRLDLELENTRLKDSFAWNAEESDSAIQPFARRLVKERNLPGSFVYAVVQAIQSQLAEFRSLAAPERGEECIQVIRLEVRVNSTLLRDQILWDVNDPSSDPEGFARQLCADLDIADQEVAPAVALAIREHLYEVARQNTGMRDSRSSKRARQSRGLDLYGSARRQSSSAISFMRRPNGKSSVIRRKKELEGFEPVVEILTPREVETLDARDERNARIKRRQDDREENFGRYFR